MIVINGKHYSGLSVSIINDSIFIDGKKVDSTKENILEIKVIGDLAKLTTDKSVTVNGNIKGDVEVGGSITCGDVDGNINVGGSITCDDINGSVNAGGSVSCDDVAGNVLAEGRVNY